MAVIFSHFHGHYFYMLKFMAMNEADTFMGMETYFPWVNVHGKFMIFSWAEFELMAMTMTFPWLFHYNFMGRIFMALSWLFHGHASSSDIWLCEL